MQDFEKLGAFYLGKVVDQDSKEITESMVLYDAKDLCTHALCMGMTGSGKTGLCLSLLEEAAIDQVPVLAIDPKGDLGNLLLAFPDLAPSDFAPWVDASEASRKGKTVEQFAADTAQMWSKGLADWGQDKERVARLKASADVAIYTPGSTAGLSLSILNSFSAPSAEVVADADAMRDRVQGAVSGLLALLGINADPLRSREHILIANILDKAWRAGKSMGVAELIVAIQQPAFDKIGVMDIDTFYPSKDRFALSMQLNNLLASPGFASWMEGDPLDIQRLLYTAEGKPRISVLSIAHLSESERMFFVTLLLNEVVSWMRGQAGTSSLRALVYMDEVFGFFPPTANPPSKMPMLTLLKQARAFGLGVVLATQNPVDLDYKGLSNIGTWFIGRLQTERDKLRVLDGLEGASSKDFNRSSMERLLSGLGKRVFLMHNVHEDAPVLFHTRWAMSYLRGPLTRTQIQSLMAERKANAAAKKAAPPNQAPQTSAQQAPATQSARQASQPTAATASATAATATATAPVLPAEANQVFLPLSAKVPEGGRIIYKPTLLTSGQLHFVSAKASMDAWQDRRLLVPFDPESGRPDWDAAIDLGKEDVDTDQQGEPNATWDEPPKGAKQKRSYTSWKKQLITKLYQDGTLELKECKKPKLVSKAAETAGDFTVRVRQAARELRDAEVDKMRTRYTPKLDAMQDRIYRAEQKVDQEESQYKNQRMQTVVSIGATMLGAMFGRKSRGSRIIGRASSSARTAGRMGREKQDIQRAIDDLERLQVQMERLEAEFHEKVSQVQEKFDPDNTELLPLLVRPRKSDIVIEQLSFCWQPWTVDAAGAMRPAWE